MRAIFHKRLLISCWICCLITLLLFLSSATGQEAENNKKYTFSTDWFSRNIPAWEKALQPWKGKEGIRYLEIGVFEGRSFCWMLDNILTHPTARATGIDIFSGDYKRVFLSNLLISGAVNKVETITGTSQEALRRFQPESFDIIYIDGSHIAADVLADAVLSWPLLRNNGLMLFDDYRYHVTSDPLELRPQVAIDTFITVRRNNLEIIHSGFTLILRKHVGAGTYLALGPYEYDWYKKNLYTAGQGELVPLSDKEREMIEKLFMGRGFGEVKFSPTPEMLNDADFLMLVERLKLDFVDKPKTPSK